MNKIISEGIDAATEVAAKLTDSKNKNGGGGFPYKTVLVMQVSAFARLSGYTPANARTSLKGKISCVTLAGWLTVRFSHLMRAI